MHTNKILFKKLFRTYTILYKAFITTAVLLFFFIPTSQKYSVPRAEAGDSTVLLQSNEYGLQFKNNTAAITPKATKLVPKRDPRSLVLEQYLIRQKSLLRSESDTIIELSDLYKIDYKLIVAIAGTESGYCAAMSYDYNCWGYGSYSFDSMKQAVKEYMRLMNTWYFKKGLRSINAISQIYSTEPEEWVRKVNFHYSKIP